MGDAHLEGFARSFVLKPKRDRLLELLRRRNGHARFVAELHDLGRLDPRYARPVAHAHAFARPLFDLLCARGAPAECYVASESRDVDERTLPLAEALDRIVDSGAASIVSCIPGRLVWFEDEYASGCRLCERDTRGSR